MLNCKKSCHFFIMQPDWTERQKKECLNFVRNTPSTFGYITNRVNFIDVENSILSSLVSWRGYHCNYYKLIAHLYLSSEVERILYLDTDTIILKDINQYYSMDFQDNYLIASNESLSKKGYDYLFKEHKGYVNTGILLINLKKMRDEGISINFYTEAAKLLGPKYFADQELLGYVFHNMIKVLPSYKYNHLLFHEDSNFGYNKIFSMTKEERKKEVCSVFYDEEFDETQNETIIHFAGHVSKPWDCMVTVKDGNPDIIIPYLKHNLSKEIVCRFYFKWWEIAQLLPVQIYSDLLKEAFEKVIEKPLRNTLKWHDNALLFFESVCYDCTSELHFINYIQKLSGKRISILKSGDKAAKYLNKIADLSSIEVVFSSSKNALNLLTDVEWNKCKQADIIINCCVHGTKPDKRDGIKPIMIWDVLKDDSMFPKESNYSLVLSNNKLHDELEYTRHELQKQITLLSDKLMEINKITGEKDKLANENKVLREEKARLNTETVVLNNKLENSVKEYELLKDDSENKIKSLMLENERLSNESAIKINELNKQITQYENSRSWKVTKSFRSILWFFIKRFSKASLS